MNNRVFESYLSRALDRDLSPEEFAEFERHLIASPEARARYMEYVDLHTVLDLELKESTPEQLGTSKVIDVKRIIRRQKRRSRQIALFSAAAILLIGLITMQLFLVRERSSTLTFETSPGTQFALTHSGMNDEPEGLILKKGSRLQLSQGTVELTFESGVKSIVMAPADMTLHDDDILFLNKGTAWFQVPKGAEGFTVKTSDLDIVDLGTEFGVVSKPNDHDEVHVFKGKVKATAKRVRRESSTVTTGQAVAIDPIGRLTPITLNTNSFLTKLPTSLPYFHWSFDELTDGGFAAEGSHPDLSLGLAKPDSVSASSLLVSGIYGKAVRFSGKRGQEIETAWAGITGARPRTVMGWVRLPEDGDPGNFAGLVGWGTRSEEPNKWKLVVAPEKVKSHAYLRIAGEGSRDGGTNLADGKWHHVACVFAESQDGEHTQNYQLYVDGKLELFTHRHGRPGDRLNTITDMPRSIPVSFGTDLHHRSVKHMRDIFRGDIDEVFIIEGALGQETISRIMHTHAYSP